MYTVSKRDNASNPLQSTAERIASLRCRAQAAEHAGLYQKAADLYADARDLQDAV
jgi:hypothetical protein